MLVSNLLRHVCLALIEALELTGLILSKRLLIVCCKPSLQLKVLLITSCELCLIESIKYDNECAQCSG